MVHETSRVSSEPDSMVQLMASAVLACRGVSRSANKCTRWLAAGFTMSLNPAFRFTLLRHGTWASVPDTKRVVACLCASSPPCSWLLALREFRHSLGYPSIPLLGALYPNRTVAE